MPERLLPEMWPVARVARELGKASHVLVDASRRGEFPPVVRVGGCWYVRADACRDWFDRQHAESLSEAQLAQIRQAGRDPQAAEARRPARRPDQPRARTAGSC